MREDLWKWQTGAQDAKQIKSIEHALEPGPENETR